MKLGSLILLAGLVSSVEGAADISNVEVTYQAEYKATTTPTQIEIKSTHAQLVANGGAVVYTFDTAVFGNSVTPTCAGSVTSGGLSSVACSVGASGLVLTATLTSTGNAIDAAATLTLTVTASTAGDLLALPSAATQVQLTAVTANGGTDTLDGTSTVRVSWFAQAAPTITLTSTDLNAGTTPSSLQVQFTTPFAVASGQTIVFTASQSVFTASVTTGAPVTGATLSGYTTTSATVFTATLGANLAENTAVDITMPTAMMAALPSVAGAVTIDITLNSIVAFNDATGFGTIVASGGAGSDPIARLGNVVREFELPLYTKTLLLESPDLVVHGSVFPGNPSEQWFDRIILSTPDNMRFMEVKVKKDLEHVNASQVPRSFFGTLDVTLGYGTVEEPLATTSVKGPHHEVPFHFMGHHMLFRRVRRNAALSVTTANTLPRECVDMAGNTVHLYVCSSPASEYYGDLNKLALRYMHLDLVFVEVKNFQLLSGVLPELWNVKPMSETTKSYLKQPKEPQAECQKLYGASAVCDGSKDIENSSISDQNASKMMEGGEMARM